MITIIIITIMITIITVTIIITIIIINCYFALTQSSLGRLWLRFCRIV